VVSLCIFDLDGTLIDSRLDLANSVNAMLAEAGRPPLEHPVIFSYVGNGAPVLIRRSLGDQATEAEVQEALEYFLEYYRDHALDFTTLYPGVKESLERFRAASHSMAILTNKPVRISKAIADGLGVGGYFFQVYGGNSFEFKKPNPIGIDALRQETGASHAETIMVGDSTVDMQTARNAGVRCCGVSYGFQPESLNDPAPDVLVDRMEAFADWLANESLR